MRRSGPKGRPCCRRTSAPTDYWRPIRPTPLGRHSAGRRRASGPGPYRLVRELGRGGMGMGYLAERDDGHFHLRVAIRFIIPGPSTAELVERFLAERQILAALDHPRVARLLDGGVTGEGWPYCTMEYVDGEPLDVYARRGQLSAAEEMIRGALARRRRALGDEHPNVAVDLHNLGVVLRAAGRREEAAAALRDALALRRRTLGDAHPQTAETVRELAAMGS